MKISIFIMWVGLSISALIASTAGADSMGKAVFLNSDDLHWGDAPSSLPKGAKMSVLHGDPSKPGPFVIRFTTPGEYSVPPHYHSRAETLTILSGKLFVGEGTRYDTTAAHALNVGGFHYLAAKTPHYVFSKTPTTVEIHGDGPFDIIYINPADDPQRHDTSR